MQGSKGYRAEALLGFETTTQDSEGEVTEKGEWEHVTREAIDGALQQFTGDIMQVPRSAVGLVRNQSPHVPRFRLVQDSRKPSP